MRFLIWINSEKTRLIYKQITGQLSLLESHYLSFLNHFSKFYIKYQNHFDLYAERLIKIVSELRNQLN